MKEISTAMELIEVKKDNLRKAFEELQAHSSTLSSSFSTLTWSDLDSYFTSLQSSLQQNFQLLQALCPPSPEPKLPPSSSRITNSDPVPVPARPELRSFCEKMDGLGLRKYIAQRPRERTAIRVELLDAFQYAPDPATMVLDAMDGFHVGNGGDEDSEFVYVRSCVILLEELMAAKREIMEEVKERARKLGVEWKEKMNGNGEKPMQALTFLLLLATFGLADGFDINHIINCIVTVSNNRLAIELCRLLVPAHNFPDAIQKLITKGKQLTAVKFIFEFGLNDKFRPKLLLEDYLKDSVKLAQKIRKNGRNSRQSLNEAAIKEISALKSIVKCIEDHSLESEYPKKGLLELLEKLQKEKANRKRSTAPAHKPQQQPNSQKHGQNKRARTKGPVASASIHKNIASTSNVPTLKQPHIQPAGLLPDHPAQYLDLPPGAYGLAGSAPAVASYADSSAVLYGMSGAALGLPGNLTTAGSNLHVSDPQIPSGYYDRPVAYGGYSLPPQYHPAYYP